MSRTATTVLEADQKYKGTVREGCALIETMGGTLGFQVLLNCDAGRTSYTIWLTPKNRERAAKDFATLGVSQEKLQNAQYVEYQLAMDVAGVEVTFGTREEEYQGKKRIKVAWIAKPGIAVDGNKAAAVATLFGAPPKNGRAQPAAPDMAPDPSDPDPITDDDVPF